jgi:hypothetical protein
MISDRHLAQLAARLLDLYPASFRAEFADEMADVLAASLAAAARRGRIALFMTVAREVVGLLLGVVREHRRVDREQRDSTGLRPDDVGGIRVAARLLALLCGIWWLMILLWNEDVRADSGLLVGVVVVLALGGTLLEPLRRRVASYMLLAGGLLIAMMMVLLPLFKGLPISPGVAVAASMPLLIAGSLTHDTPVLNRQRQRGGELTLAVGCMALASGWWALMVLTSALTELWLVPWDTWAEPIRPPHGTWQRGLNDFFEGGVGARLPAMILIASGLFALLMRLRAGEWPLLAVWTVASANLLVIVICILALPLVDMLQPVAAEQIGYTSTWPGILVLVLSSVMLLSLGRYHVKRHAAEPDPLART